MASEDQKLPVYKRIAGWLLLLGVCVGGFAIGMVIWRFSAGPQPTTPQPATPEATLGIAVVGVIAGVFCLGVGAAAYAVTIATNCFTFSFNKPCFGAFKAKLWVAKILVPLPIAMGLGLFFALPLSPILAQLGVPQPFTFMGPLFLALLVVQLATTWLDIWSPIDRSLLRKRMAAMGVGSDELSSGTMVGVSDPTKSSMKKMTLVEDDIGIMWLEPDRLVYRGDSTEFVIHRDDVIAVEAKANGGSMAAYAGAVNPIVRHRLADGREQSTRFHNWGGDWTLGGVARSLKGLLAQLEAWHAGGSAPSHAAADVVVLTQADSTQASPQGQDQR